MKMGECGKTVEIGGSVKTFWQPEARDHSCNDCPSKPAADDHWAYTSEGTGKSVSCELALCWSYS